MPNPLNKELDMDMGHKPPLPGSNGQTTFDYSSPIVVPSLVKEPELSLVATEVPGLQVAATNQQPVLETITPDLAKYYLSLNTRNRPKIRAVIEEYKRQLLNNQWYTTHQGIAFYLNNTLADGQHRLMAILETGISINLWVYRGLSLAAGVGIDVGRARLVNDQLVILGVNTDRRVTEVASRMIDGGVTKKKRTAEDVRPWVENYYPGVSFATDLFRRKKSGVCQAAVVAVLARAYYNTTKHGDLVAFAFVLMTGYGQNPEPRDRNAIQLRDQILMTKPSRVKTGVDRRASVYWRTEAALFSYLRGEIKTVREANSELFPLPDEDKLKK